MDEDLKIVLTSELEADEQASAQRISAQLPNIAKIMAREISGLTFKLFSSCRIFATEL